MANPKSNNSHESVDQRVARIESNSTIQYTGPIPGLTDPSRNYKSHRWKTMPHDFGRWLLTPMGFAITIYGLNIIAWGGMLFLLLCNAAPQMCHPSCNDLYSSRRIWIEYDSQILNALFCVTGFGLFPWRARDLYLWCRWRLGLRKAIQRKALERLGEVHANWFQKSIVLTLPQTTTRNRHPGNETAAHSTPTPNWKLDVVIWGNILNSVFQVCLAACMWVLNRFDRPSWTTGLLVALACVAAGIPGIIMWMEKKRIKKANEHPGALLFIPLANSGLPGATAKAYTQVDQEE